MVSPHSWNTCSKITSRATFTSQLEYLNASAKWSFSFSLSRSVFTLLYLRHIWLFFVPADDCLTIILGINASKNKTKLRSLFSPFSASMEVTGQMLRRWLIAAHLKNLEGLNHWRCLTFFSLLPSWVYCFAFTWCATCTGRQWNFFVQFFSNGCDSFCILQITTELYRMNASATGDKSLKL